MHILTTTILVLSAVAALSAQTADWSRFRGPNGTGVADAPGCRPSSDQPSNVRVENRRAGRTLLAGADGDPDLPDRRSTATRCSCSPTTGRPAGSCGAATCRARARIVSMGRTVPASPSPVTDGRPRLRLLPGLRPHRLHDRRARAVAHAARAVQHLLRLRRLADRRRRHWCCWPSTRTSARTCSPSTRRPGKTPLQDRSSRRDLRLLDADGLSAEEAVRSRSSFPNRSSCRPMRSPTASGCGGCAGWPAR